MRLYHGSRDAFDAFDPQMVGTGAEPNSALGVWLSRDPRSAYGYGGNRHLAIAEIAAPRLAVCSDEYVAIWGARDLSPLDGEIAWPLFDEARKILMAEGYQGVLFDCVDTEMEGAVCIFEPETVSIVETLTFLEDHEFDPMENPHDDSVVDHHQSLEEVLSGLARQDASLDA